MLLYSCANSAYYYKHVEWCIIPDGTRRNGRETAYTIVLLVLSLCMNGRSIHRLMNTEQNMMVYFRPYFTHHKFVAGTRCFWHVARRSLRYLVFCHITPCYTFYELYTCILSCCRCVFGREKKREREKERVAVSDDIPPHHLQHNRHSYIFHSH